MKRAKYSAAQTIWILKEVEGGRTIKDVYREYGISDAKKLAQVSGNS